MLTDSEGKYVCVLIEYDQKQTFLCEQAYWTETYIVMEQSLFKVKQRALSLTETLNWELLPISGVNVINF